MKNVRDSVHGNIIVESKYVDAILDTPAFQRLRRIEQTAIRSIYPSARHDRFIHSLGVYYIGSLIVSHLQNEFESVIEAKDGDGTYYGFSQNEIERIKNSYLIACLLHDIAHAPFSHTFEKYYGSQPRLFEELNSLLEGNLTGELKKVESPNFHEYASAIVAFHEYKDVIEHELNADVELVCRMIIGGFYKKEKEPHELHNCFISLLHGDVVDADRIDYACRDVWASGYCTSSIDIERLVAAIHIRKEKKTKELNVCFDCNALNEISNMLDVRQFQNRYVINHHSVQYEQALMVRAAELAAMRKYGAQDGDEALRNFINIESCMSKRLSDEDLLMLMKEDVDNGFYKEFSSRRYTRFAIWKTPDEFFAYFRKVPRGVSLKHTDFEERVRMTLKESMGIDDVLICDVKYKPSVNLKSLYIVVNDEMLRYTDIHQELKVDLSDVERDIVFYYVYVSKQSVQGDLDEYRSKLVKCLTPLFDELYPLTIAEEPIYNYLLSGLKKVFETIEPERKEERGQQIDRLKKKMGLKEFVDMTKIREQLENC